LLKETFVNVVHDDIRERMSTITVPTLIVWWSEDTYTPLVAGKLIHSLIPDSVFVVCEGERHGIHLHNPTLLVSTITSFLWKTL
jgi:pimeloyl-ACP methyl ester carboxylesterase